MQFINRNALFLKLLESYRQLEVRDQVALKLLTLFFLLLFSVFGVWQPLQAFVDDSQALHDSNLELIEWMNGTEEQARSISGNSRSKEQSGQSLLTLVSRSARSTNIKPNKLQAEGTESVSVWFDAVSFNDLMRWLEKLEAEEGVLSASITLPLPT